MSKPNQREGVQFNPIRKAANVDKYDKVYDDNDETEDELPLAPDLLVALIEDYVMS